MKSEETMVLVKVLGEIRETNRLLRKLAQEPEPVVPEKKPWSSSPRAVSVTKVFGRSVAPVTADQDVPQQLTEEERRVMAAQESDGRLKPGERIRDTRPVEPVEDPTVVRLTQEQIDNFKGVRR
jgi:hypothetical protein